MSAPEIMRASSLVMYCRSVARFDFDRMDILKLLDVEGLAVAFDELASGGWERLPPALHLAAR